MKRIIILLVATLPSMSQAIAQPGNEADAPDAAPVAVVKEFFNAYSLRDHARVSSLLHPEILWVQPGDNPIAGVKKSREEVLQMGKRMSELSEKSITLAEIKFLNASGNSVACILRWKAAKPTGAVLDVENVDIYTVENGKIVYVKVYSADLTQENEFWRQ